MSEELAKARAREAATREILEVMSLSRDDDRPVFDVILRNAARLCKAPIAVDRPSAHHNHRDRVLSVPPDDGTTKAGQTMTEMPGYSTATVAAPRTTG